MSHSRNLARPTRLASVTAACVFVATAALYIYTAGPTLGGGHDSAEFQHVAYTLGIAHPTGYPLYLILGKIFTTLNPVGNIAYRMNVLSALLGAGAALLFFLNARLLTGCLMASLAATAIFATNVAVWRQSGVASVNPLNLLLIGALVYALLLWSEGRASLASVGLLFGLGLAHHRSVLLLLPSAVLLVLACNLAKVANLRKVSYRVVAICFVLPLLLYLYLPIFGNSSPWYSNTLQGFINQTAAGEAGSYIRLTATELVDAVVALAQFLFDSFSYIGSALIAVAFIGVMPRVNRWRTAPAHPQASLFLGSATIVMLAFAILFNSEQDRYFSLPFYFLALWFAIGAATFDTLLETRLPIKRFYPAARTAFAIALILLVIVPFDSHYSQANWNSYDREYKQWDEVFTLPLPPGAIIVGDWRQLNGMRYMQSVEQRRPDITLVGTMYESEPQTEAAQYAFADGRAIFLAPGIALPKGSYRYAVLGPLLQVRDQPKRQAPEPTHSPIAMMPALTLVDYEITTALEPYAPTTRVAPTRSVRANLVWRAESPLRDFLVRISLYDPDRRLISQKDEAPVRGLYPPSNWENGEYVSDVKNFLIPAGTPPGNYVLKMMILDAESKRPTTDEITLGSFGVDPATNVPLDQVFMQHDFGDGIGRRVLLAGYGGLDGTYRSGERLSFYIVWSVHDKLAAAAQVHVSLQDDSGKAIGYGKTLGTWTRALLSFYPTERWQAGERLKAYYDIDLPNDLMPGDYDFWVGIDQEPSANITRIHIRP